MAFRLNKSLISICQITGRLDLHGHHLDVLPREVFSQEIIDSLQVLDLSGNRLKELPQDVILLKNLKELIVDHNALRDLPLSLTFLPNLRGISLEGNEKTLEQNLVQIYSHSKLIGGKSKCRDVFPLLYYLSEREKEGSSSSSFSSSPFGGQTTRRARRDAEEMGQMEDEPLEEPLPSSRRRFSMEELPLHRLPVDRTAAPYAEQQEALSQRQNKSVSRQFYGQIDSAELQSQFSERRQAAEAQKDKLGILAKGSNALGEEEVPRGPQGFAPLPFRLAKAKSGRSTLEQLQSTASITGEREEEEEGERLISHGRRSGYAKGSAASPLPPFGSEKTKDFVRQENEQIEQKNAQRNSSLASYAGGTTGLKAPYAASSSAFPSSSSPAGIRRTTSNPRAFQVPFATVLPAENPDVYRTSKQVEAASLAFRKNLEEQRAAGLREEELSHSPHRTQQKRLQGQSSSFALRAGTPPVEIPPEPVVSSRVRPDLLHRHSLLDSDRPFGTEKDVPPGREPFPTTLEQRLRQQTALERQNVAKGHAENDAKLIRQRGHQGYGIF